MGAVWWRIIHPSKSAMRMFHKLFFHCRQRRRRRRRREKLWIGDNNSSQARRVRESRRQVCHLIYFHPSLSLAAPFGTLFFIFSLSRVSPAYISESESQHKTSLIMIKINNFYFLLTSVGRCYRQFFFYFLVSVFRISPFFFVKKMFY